MALKTKLTGVGLTVRHALQIGGTVANSLTATGTNQGTALLLSYDDCHVFTTVASGTGCIFAGATVYCQGDQVLIANHGANALLVYPATGGTIEAGATNAAVSLPSKATALFESIDGLNWTVISGLQVPVPAVVNPYVIHFGLLGSPLANSQATYIDFEFAVTFPANFGAISTGQASGATGTANATGSTAFSIDKRSASPNTWGTNIGSITIASSGVTPTFATAGGVAITTAAGDKWRLIGPGSADATFANLFGCLVGTR